jgi:NADH:ubiquinone oxidoreductase subunit H
MLLKAKNFIEVKQFFFIMLQILYLLLEGLSVIVPILLAVAMMTIVERKALAATQRRVGPNTVGYYGVLQPLNYIKYLYKVYFYCYLINK